MRNVYISKEYLLEKGYVEFNEGVYLFPDNHFASITRITPMSSMVDYRHPDHPHFNLKMKVSKREELEKIVLFVNDILHIGPIINDDDLPF